MQQRSLMQDWGIASHLIRNPIQLRHVPCDEGWFPAARRTSPYVLWVGRADRFSKRGDLCLELARRCPEQSFVVVMNRGDRSEFDELTRDLPPNVLFYERVAPDKIETLYRHAALLVNTSTAEGFPNSFLQAGKFGVPILSWQVDPDGMLERQGCGVCCRGDFGQMPDRLRTLMNHGIDYHRHSRAVWEYVHQHHDLDQCATQFMQLVQSTVDSQLAKTLWPASPFPSNRPAQERCA
jgi:glycosyltransferase involved in cell wall biosynthesis